MRVRTRCLHAVRTLFVRCSCAVRALFVRCLCERELTRELRDAPVCRAPHTVPTTRMATGPQPQPPPAGAHRRRAQAPRPALRPPLASKPRLGALWWCRSVTYQRSPRTGGCATIWLAPSQPAASGSHQAGQRGAGHHLSATWLLSAGIVRHSTTGLACVNRRSTEPTPGSVITVLPPHGAPLLLLAEGRGQRKGGRHRGTARRAAVDASRAPHEVEAGCLFH